MKTLFLASARSVHSAFKADPLFRRAPKKPLKSDKKSAKKPLKRQKPYQAQDAALPYRDPSLNRVEDFEGFVEEKRERIAQEERGARAEAARLEGRLSEASLDVDSLGGGEGDRGGGGCGVR